MPINPPKAREAYSALYIEESCQYEVVQADALKVYELVPETYRQRFRSTTKRKNQTYIEFVKRRRLSLTDSVHPKKSTVLRSSDNCC